MGSQTRTRTSETDDMATATITEPLLASQTLGRNSDFLYELIDGQAVELSERGTRGSLLAASLFGSLLVWVNKEKRVRLVFETLFQTTESNGRRPDLAFVSYDRWAATEPVPDTHAWDVIPDLFIEIISKTDEAWDVLSKVHEYFRAGAKAVWLVYPHLAVFHVFESVNQIRVFTRADVLDGGEVFPGFRLSLASFFEEEPEGPAAEPVV